MNRQKRIANIDLGSFERPVIPGQRSFTTRALWYIASALFFQGVFALLPSPIKVKVLKAFGAKIGRGTIIKPRVTIKSPWFLEIGDNVWIGEMVWIDNHTTVRIGSNSCVSQGAYIYTGNHDWKDPAFSFFCRPVVIGQGVWITAFQKVGPGSEIPSNVALLSG